MPWRQRPGFAARVRPAFVAEPLETQDIASLHALGCDDGRVPAQHLAMCLCLSLVLPANAAPLYLAGKGKAIVTGFPTFLQVRRAGLSAASRRNCISRTDAEAQGNEENDVEEKGLSYLPTLLPSYLPFFSSLRLCALQFGWPGRGMARDFSVNPRDITIWSMLE